jgi:hypothetical protein
LARVSAIEQFPASVGSGAALNAKLSARLRNAGEKAAAVRSTAAAHHPDITAVAIEDAAAPSGIIPQVAPSVTRRSATSAAVCARLAHNCPPEQAPIVPPHRQIVPHWTPTSVHVMGVHPHA